MSRTPAVNPNVHDIADRAKHAYALGTQLVAQTHYRLAELAGLGLLDPDESMSLQLNLTEIWGHLHFGTVGAVRDEGDDGDEEEDYHAPTGIAADNTYSDGRTVMIQNRIETLETSEHSWEHNRFLLDDGAIIYHQRGTICCISPPNPEDDRGWAGSHFLMGCSPRTISASRRTARHLSDIAVGTAPKNRKDNVICVRTS